MAAVLELDYFREQYKDHPFKLIPLLPNKKWGGYGWNVRSPDDQFRDCPKNSGIGAVGSHVIDCDTTDAIKLTEQFLALTQAPYYRIQTPSGKYQYHVRFWNIPDNAKTYYSYPSGGEIRINAICGLPDTDIRGKTYQQGIVPIIQPSLDFWLTMAWYGARFEPKKSGYSGKLPFDLFRRQMPAWVSEAVALVNKATEGQKILAWNSRSECVKAILSALILAGWKIEDIRPLITYDKGRREFDKYFQDASKIVFVGDARVKAIELYPKLQQNNAARVWAAMLREAHYHNRLECLDIGYERIRELSDVKMNSSISYALNQLIDKGMIQVNRQGFRIQDKTQAGIRIVGDNGLVSQYTLEDNANVAQLYPKNIARVLSYFDRHREAVSVADMAEAMNYDPENIRKAINVMLDRDLLEKSGSLYIIK